MIDAENISNLLVTAIAFVIFIGYFVFGILMYRQVGTLCKMLGTNLSLILKLAALVHIVMIIVAGILAFILN